MKERVQEPQHPKHRCDFRVLAGHLRRPMCSCGWAGAAHLSLGDAVVEFETHRENPPSPPAPVLRPAFPRHPKPSERTRKR